ncbi:MAG TPA: hypothetical protein VN653_16330 [Anaerolineales bacterium]|nr:hypothetical protein [Anaerolineales bacterium]
MHNEDKLIYDLLDDLINSPTRPEEIQICPICGGKLHVRFGAYKRYNEDLFGVSLDCDSCNIAMAIDYAVAPPAWLIE